MWITERYYSAAFYITDYQVHSLLINVCGEVLETAKLEVKDENFEAAIVSYLDTLSGRKEIRAIGLGVPGIVEGNGYWRQNKQTGELMKEDLGGRLVSFDSVKRM